MTAAMFATLSAIILIFAFALILGAQAFDTFVNVPIFFADPPRSIEDYLNGKIARRVPAYFVRTLGFMLVATIVCTIGAVRNNGPVTLFIAVGCAALYIALLVVFFIPANRKLGFLPGRRLAPSRDEVLRLVRMWQGWNFVRLLVLASGLAAAAISVGR